MRSYNTPTADASGAKIWEAARATSAAPTFFEPVLIDGRPFGDGGTGWNNPTAEAIAEANKIWPNRRIGCLLSIGTGLEDAIQLGDGHRPSKVPYAWILHKLAPKASFELEVARYCVECLTSCEKVHDDVCSKFPDRILFEANYFRFNVPQGISAIGLEEWNRIGDVIDLTEKYMEKADMENRKLKVAELLLNPHSVG
jgi:Patatin-like phospholipase